MAVPTAIAAAEVALLELPVVEVAVLLLDDVHPAVRTSGTITAAAVTRWRIMATI
jgi:hypothetical protein